MPRQSALLPYVSLTRHGRLQYFRRVLPEHRHRFENRASFHAFAIHSAGDQFTPLSSNYEAVLKGRRMDWYFTIEDWDGVRVDDSDT